MRDLSDFNAAGNRSDHPAAVAHVGLGRPPQAEEKSAPEFARAAVEYRAQQQVNQAKYRYESQSGAKPPATHVALVHNRFVLERIRDITDADSQSGLIKGLIPGKGCVAFYGKPGTGKSFAALDVALTIALGEDTWGGHRVRQAPAVYVASEGSGGMPDRVKGALRLRGLSVSDADDFRLIRDVPNLGANRNDCDVLIAKIKAANVVPGLVVIDTLSSTLGASDENGGGMTQFVQCMNELSHRLSCCVLVVHHSPHSEDRMRGHSSLPGAMDMIFSVTRGRDPFTALLTAEKAKDFELAKPLKLTFKKVVLRVDADGDQICTLAVRSIEATSERKSPSKSSKPANLPDSSKLMMTVIKESLEGEGKLISLGQGAAKVKGVAEDVVRREYYARLAEDPRPNETPAKLADRQRQSFGRGLNGLLNRELVLARTHDDQRYLCLPGPAPTRTATAPYKGGRPSRPASDDAKGTGCVQMSSERVQSRPDVLRGLEHNSGRSGTRSDAVQSRPDVLLGVGNDTLTDACDYLAQLDGPSLEADALVRLADALTEGRDDDALPVSAEVDDVEWLSYEPDDVTDDPPDVQPPPWLDRDFYHSIPCNSDRPPQDADESDEASS